MTSNTALDKLKSYVSSLTPEEHKAMLSKALEARRLNKERREANAHLYKTIWPDSSYWQELSSKYSIRMPNEYAEPTPKSMRKYCNKLKITSGVWLADCGLTKLQQWIDLNPKHTLYAFVGNLLEWKDSQTQTLVLENN